MRNSNDPRSVALKALLAAWHKEYGAQEKTLREIVGDARPDANGLHHTKHGAELWSAVFSLAPDGEQHINLRALSWALRRIKGRIFDGLRLLEGGARSSQTWRVARVGAPEGADDEPQF